MCINEPTVENLWTLKVLLRGFEMVLGFKVKFYKSCFIGINVSMTFMEMACNFLNCSEGKISFIFLG